MHPSDNSTPPDALNVAYSEPAHRIFASTDTSIKVYT
jgi:hypothetical protein